MTASNPSSSLVQSKLQFTIGIDGGGTKTIGKITNQLNGEQFQLTVGPSSLSNDYAQAKTTLANLLTDLMSHFSADPSQTVVVVGVAGGGVDSQARQLQQDLPFLFARLDIHNDAKTSLVGANGGEPIAMVALGTGSVGARLEKNGHESYIGGWGFPIGDGGSGAKLGFYAVQALLNELDSYNQAQSELAKVIQTALLNTDLEPNLATLKQGVANWLAAAQAKDFAQLTPLVLSTQAQCSVANDVVSQHVEECERLILQTRGNTELDVVLMGGLAEVTLAKLAPSVAEFCRLGVDSALDGACILAMQAYQQVLRQPRQKPITAKAKISIDNKAELLAQLSNMVSETPNPESTDLDLLPTTALLELMNRADQSVPDAIASCLDDISRAVALVVQSFDQGGRLIYMGAGTSGRLGILDAVECPPTFSVEAGQVIGLIAGGNNAIYQAVEGAEDSAELGAKDLADIHICSRDTVVGIAASGRTPYVLGGLDKAKAVGASTVSLSCNPNSVLASYAQVNICPVVGPEILTGSTRMKSGTAQKLVLNMLSTASMIKTGKSFGNLMVDVKASNQKLYVRAIRIVMQATLCSAIQAEKALEQANYHVKNAILQVLTGVSPMRAEQALEHHQGFLRQAIDALTEVK